MQTLAENENKETREEIAFLTSETTHLHRKLIQTTRYDMNVRKVDHREKPSGIWSAIHKKKKPKDLINRLMIPNTEPPQYERSSKRMVHLARNYHEDLQSDGIEETLTEIRSQQINQAISAIPNNQTMRDP